MQGPKDPLLFSHVHEKGAALKVEQPGHELVISDRGLFSTTPARAPFHYLKLSEEIQEVLSTCCLIPVNQCSADPSIQSIADRMQVAKKCRNRLVNLCGIPDKELPIGN